MCCAVAVFFIGRPSVSIGNQKDPRPAAVVLPSVMLSQYTIELSFLFLCQIPQRFYTHLLETLWGS